MSEKITDLEEFCLKQIYRPYWHYIKNDNSDTLKYLNKEFNLDKCLGHLSNNNNHKWRDLVLTRIKLCDFIFPKYIKHELVNIIIEFDHESIREGV